MAAVSPAPEKQAQPSSRDGDSSIIMLSEDVTRVAEAIEEDMKGVDLAGTLRRSIFRVPSHICGERKELFQPLIVSIGPYSRDNDGGHLNDELLGMEVVKKQFLQDLITKTSYGFLTACVQELTKQEPNIRRCYYKSFDGMLSDVFVRMMLLDGIFIIHYFTKCMNVGEEICSSISHAPWNFSMIMHDLLLLENQIPFFVLQDLFNLFVTYEIAICNCNKSDHTGKGEKPGLLDAILDVFKRQHELSKMDVKNVIKPDVEIKHLLHLYHLCYTTSKQNKKSTAEKHCCSICIRSCSCAFSQKPTAASIQSATKLQEAGVRFKKKKKPESFLDVTFNSCNGRLEIPPFVIDDMVTFKFANLISLEQSANGVEPLITSYAAFMDKIIDTSDDVEILRHEGILENMLASNEEVARFFNQLCRYSHLDIRGHKLARVFEEVDAYSKTWCHRTIAWLVHKYFSNIWVFLSFLAAVILLVLTFLQTYFTIYPR